jgi:AcrR family transcriptional regulator
MGSEKKKGTITKDRIFQAAMAVFARHPYQAASMRMIGQEGEFDHPLINYYFPTKAILFEAVTESICRKVYASNLEWYAGLQGQSLKKAFPLYLDRLIEHHKEHPEIFRILALNLAQADSVSDIPGYSYFLELLELHARTFTNTLKPSCSNEDVIIFTSSFNSLVINFLGSEGTHAGMLSLEPGSDAYYEWVKKSLVYLFLPRLREML